jgi:hypothetical protein
LPGRRAAAQRRAEARRSALRVAELARELKRLAALSQTTDQDDAAAIARETTVTWRILEVLRRGEQLASHLADDEIASAWRRLAASTGRARLLGQGPHRAAKLEEVAAGCQRLQELLRRELADARDLPLP